MRGPTRDSAVPLAFSAALLMYGAGLPVGLLIAQGTTSAHPDWTGAPEVGAYVAIALAVGLFAWAYTGAQRKGVKLPLHIKGFKARNIGRDVINIPKEVADSAEIEDVVADTVGRDVLHIRDEDEDPGEPLPAP